MKTLFEIMSFCLLTHTFVSVSGGWFAWDELAEGLV